MECRKEAGVEGSDEVQGGRGWVEIKELVEMAKKDIKRGIRYEKAKAHRASHIGCPGKSDYQRGNVKGEAQKCR